MSYTVNKTNGAVLTTIADGSTDTSTSLTLIGKNYPGYGEILNENLVRLLESSSQGGTGPASPIAGQLWWDSTNNILKVHTGTGTTTGWRPLASLTVSTSNPTSNLLTGDLWWDSDDQQLKAYSGTGWVTVGPAYSAGAGTSGAIVETILSNLAVSNTVISLYTGSTRVAIVSKSDEFTPGSSVSGFPKIYPGVTLANVSVIPGAAFTGTATNAEKLDSLDSTDFMRATTNTSTSGTLQISNNSGLYVGTTPDGRLYVSSSNVVLENQTNSGQLVLRVRDSGGVASNAMTVSGTGAISTVGNVTVGNALIVTGNIGSNLIPTANVTYSLGSTSARWTNVWGVSSSALYADLAERYESDRPLQAGTVVTIGGEKEVTTALLTDDIFGVVSSNPAYLMNDSAGTNETHPPIALIGRVPVRVLGKCSKGDKLIVGPAGVAIAYIVDPNADENHPQEPLAQEQLVGRALADKYTEEEGLVEVALAAH